MIIDDLWGPLLEPVFREVAPRRVVVWGTHPSHRCRGLGELAQSLGFSVELIDTTTPRSWPRLADEFKKVLRLHEVSALEILPKLKRAEIYLLDVEPNCYTVQAILHRIYEIAPEAIVFVGGTDWPHARRDAYRDPESVPTEFRHPHRRGGVAPGRDGVVKHGLFEEFVHAREAGGPQNGVAAGVQEQLMRQPGHYDCLDFRGGRGLTALLPASRRGEPAAARLRAFCRWSDAQAAYLEAVDTRAWFKTLEAHRLERKLERERDARSEQETLWQQERKSFDDEAKQLRDSLADWRREAEELSRRLDDYQGSRTHGWAARLRSLRQRIL